MSKADGLVTTDLTLGGRWAWPKKKDYFNDENVCCIFVHMKVYTKAQLALRNGQDRDEIWVAYMGTIYDVGGSRLWKNGKHYEHWAGQDLTDELADAPHTKDVFKKFKEVGVLR